MPPVSVNIGVSPTGDHTISSFPSRLNGQTAPANIGLRNSYADCGRIFRADPRGVVSMNERIGARRDVGAVLVTELGMISQVICLASSLPKHLANVLVTKLVANSGPQGDIERDGSARAADFRNTNQHFGGQNETGRNGHQQILSQARLPIPPRGLGAAQQNLPTPARGTNTVVKDQDKRKPRFRGAWDRG
jgi:hypothetical protein